MSYSHLRRCWFSEMPQVRCHIHRSPASKLRPLCFLAWHAPPVLYFSISFHRNKLSCDFIYISLRSLSGRSAASSSPPLRANKVRSVLFIISNNRAIAQVSIWAAALYESHPVLAVWECVRRPGERSFNHLRASKWGREKDESLRRNHKRGEASITTLLFLKWLRCAPFLSRWRPEDHSLTFILISNFKTWRMNNLVTWY